MWEGQLGVNGYKTFFHLSDNLLITQLEQKHDWIHWMSTLLDKFILVIVAVQRYFNIF